MPQVKKVAVRDAILDAAFRLFSQEGYHGSRLSQIAADAGVSPANVYVYFKSKLDIVYAIYEPWLRQRLEALEAELAGMPDPERRLRRILQALWCDIPNEHHGFANNIMQALSTATPDEGYQPLLLNWAEGRVALMLESALHQAQRSDLNVQALAHAMFMAFDGFAMHARLSGGAGSPEDIIETFCTLLLGSEAPADKAKGQPLRTAPPRSPKARARG